MRNWPLYAEKYGYSLNTINNTIKCVLLIRDPLTRLKSLYTYARSGGEHWFRYESGIMQKLSNPNITLNESIHLFWNEFGKDYLIQSHEYNLFNLKLGCNPIKMEDIKLNYNQTMIQLLKYYHFNNNSIHILLNKLILSDISKKSLKQQQINKHITSNKFNNIFIENLTNILLNITDVYNLIQLYRKELNYYL